MLKMQKKQLTRMNLTRLIFKSLEHCLTESQNDPHLPWFNLVKDRFLLMESAFTSNLSNGLWLGDFNMMSMLLVYCMTLYVKGPQFLHPNRTSREENPCHCQCPEHDMRFCLGSVDVQLDWIPSKDWLFM